LKRILALTLCLLMLCSCGTVRLDDPLQNTAPPQQDPLPEQPDSVPEKVTPEQADILTLAYEPTDSFNPYLATSSVNCFLGNLLYEGLFAIGPEGDAIPRLCTHYDASADGLTYTFYLRHGITMHDGQQLSVSDVIASLNTARKSERYGYRLRHISSVLSVEADTVTIMLDTSYEKLPLLLDVPILRASQLSADRPVGTGPYRLFAGALREHDDWWRGSVPYGEVVRLYSASTAAELADDFAADHINFVCIDPNGSATPAYHSDDSLYSIKTMTMQYLGFNLTDGPFTNAALRAAITHLIDREALVADTCGGFASEASLPTHPESGNYDSRLAGKFEYAPDDFHTAMQQAGIRDVTGDGILDLPTEEGTIPASGTMLVCGAYSLRVAAAQALAEVFKAYGIELTVQSLGYNAYVRALQNGNFDLYYGEATLSPDGDLSCFFDQQSALCLGGMADAVALQLCETALENAGNYYTLCEFVMENGLLTPVLYKQNAVYARQELQLELTPALGNALYYTPEE